MTEDNDVAVDHHKTVHSSDPADTLPKCPQCGLQVPGLSTCPNDGTNLSANPLTQSSLAGRYEFLEPIGQGGMSVIFKARQPLLKRIVAIKLMQSHLDANPQTKMRFEKEGEALSSLCHPNIVAVFDCGFVDLARPFLVMAYVEGRSLSRILKEDGPLSLRRALNIFGQICAGLEHAHRRSILHRDLKPSNIMITTEAGEERAIIVDFGVAKILDDNRQSPEHITATGETLGSPPYMSPEQCHGNKVDERSDIYSLGCLMYECLTGELPLLGRNSLETMHKQITEKPRSIRSYSGPPSLKAHIQGIIDSTLEKDPSRRYQNAADILADLDLLLSAVDKGFVPKLSSLRAYSGQKFRPPFIAISITAALALGNFWFWTTWREAPPPVMEHQPQQVEIAGDDGLSSLLNKHPHVSELVATSITGSAVGKLSELSNLRRLTLKETAGGDSALAELAKLTGLEELTLTDQKITDRALHQAGPMPGLKKLTLDAAQITEAGLSNLANFSRLDELVLHNVNVSGKGFSRLASLKKLSKLTVQATSVHEIGDDALETITRSLRDLSTLKLESSQITDGALSKLLQLKHLRRLSLAFSKKITDAGMPAVAQLTRIESLNLSGVDVTDSGLKTLSQMNHLKELYLWRARISDEGLRAISDMTALQVLHLSNTDITDTGLQYLTKLDGIIDLKLKETKITDAGLASLKNFSALTRLSLQNVSITDKGLDQLANLSGLQDMDLSETILSDSGLSKLSKLRSLKHLYLKDCPHITSSGIDMLTRTLPECTIVTRKIMPSRALE